ncbi:MAG: hypothetical protein JWO44_1234 [Bacteroidetes bacterium]|nr:hypothetical protein [Bacteroidota bacterium]
MPLPLPVSPLSSACPNWANDQARLTKLTSVISTLNTIPFGARIRANVLTKGGSTDDIRVIPNPANPSLQTLRIPSEATKKTIDLTYLCELTTIFAVDYLNDVIRNGIAGTGTPGNAYVALRDLLLKDPALSEEGFTNLSDVNTILSTTSIINTRLGFIQTTINGGGYNFNGRTSLGAVQETKNIYDSVMKLLNEFVVHESQCLFQYLFAGFLPPDVIFLGVGDGNTSTKGLYDIPGNGILFFNYKEMPSPLTTAADNYNSGELNRVGNNLQSVVHFNIYGLDAHSGSAGPSPGLGKDYMRIKITNINSTYPAGTNNSIEFNVLNLSSGFFLDRKSAFDPTIFSFSRDSVTILDKSSGTFKVQVWAAYTSLSGSSRFDEAVASVYVVQEKKETLPFDLDSENQYGNNEFVLQNSIKYVDPNATTLVWRIWDDPESLASLDKLIENLKSDRALKVSLNGKYVGKRARPFNTSIVFKKGDLTYYLNDVYKCTVVSTSAIPTPTGTTPWELKYKQYNAATVYAKNAMVVISHPSDATKYYLYKAIATGITGPFDPAKWDRQPVVEQEDNSSVFETTSTTPALDIYYSTLRYSFCNVFLTDTNIDFNVESFVSPVRSRLDLAFFNDGAKTIAQINDFNVRFTTSKGTLANMNEVVPAGAAPPAGLNTGTTYIPIYNIPLSYLRSFGFWEALKDRIKSRAAELTTLTPIELSAINLKLENAFDATFVRIPTERSGGPLKFTAFKQFKKIPDWDDFKWQP